MQYRVTVCLNGFLLESENGDASLVFQSAEKLCETLYKILNQVSPKSALDLSGITICSLSDLKGLDNPKDGLASSFQKILKKWAAVKGDGLE